MKIRSLMMAVATATVGLSGVVVSTAAQAQAKEQFFPVLPYRTGAYAPNGVPWANGYADYLKLINARDGGINGVKISFEECDTGYATDRGVECYERMKGKAQGAIFQPLSTGITFALTEKAPGDKNSLITGGYGRSESSDGGVFKWNFPLMGTYWSGADIIMQHITKLENGNLKGKKNCAGVPRQPVRQRAHSSDAGARENARLRIEPVACHCTWCGAKGHLAASASTTP